MPVYAQIRDGIVVNKIVLSDPNLIPVFSAGFDDFIEVTEPEAVPEIGEPLEE